jgi:hypothetical protein
VALALDTLAYARKLREAGFTERQAEAQAEALAAAMTDTLATKQDVQALETRIDFLERHLDTRLSEQAAIYNAGLSDLERRMTTRLGALTVAGVALISTLVAIF